MLTIADRIRAQAQRSPEAVAVESAADRLTYAQLVAQAAGLATRLAELGVGPGEPVAVAVARGVDMVAAILGVQMSGAAYVPLDPEHPAERLNYILNDTRARVLITADAVGFPRLRAGIRVALDDVPVRPDTDDWPALDPDSPAYVIYTSGSTGRPKGVQVTHRSLLNHHLSMLRHPGLPDGAVMPAVATVSFDPSTVEMFLPLMTGGRVVVARQTETTDPHRLAALLARTQARVLQATPVTWLLLVESGWSPPPGFAVLTGGERMPTALADRLLAAGAVVWDLYGPTETTVWATMTRYERGTPPQFHTALGASLYVLDDRLQPVPAGGDGELYIAGPGLAIGYLGRPALTAERYVAHPLADAPGERLYRTGDIARQHPGGRIEILGRSDDQIKIRGFRIEPGEIENVLTDHPGVAGAVVLAVEEPGGDRRLVGYVRPSDPADPPRARRLRAHLAKSLPSYMVPAQFVVLDAFPTTPTGKVNRLALPTPPPLARRDEIPAGSAQTADDGQPAGATQRMVAAILADVLERPDVGLYDDFFVLGGDSLRAVQAILRLNEELGREVPINALFEERTVYGLSLLVDADADATPEPQLVPCAAEGRPRRLSPAQWRLLLHQDANPNSTVHNEPLAMRVPEPFDLSALQAAVTGLVNRHEILRTRYGLDDIGRRVPVVLPPGEVRLDVEEGDPQAVLAAETARPFSLAEEPPVRFRLVRPSPGEQAVLLLVVHRIAADDRSRELIARQLRAGYRGRVVSAPALSYADYAEWQRELAASPAAARHQDFWRATLAGLRPARLRTDRPRPPRRDWRGAGVRFSVPAEVAQRVRDLALEHETTMSVGLLAAFLGVLDPNCDRVEGDLTVGGPVDGRRRPELEELIGVVEDLAVVRVNVDDRPPFERLLVRVRDAVLAAQDHAAATLEDLVAGVLDVLPEELEPGRNPLFDVWFDARGVGEAGDEAAGFALPRAPETEYDLCCRVAERADGGLDGRIDYAVKLFDEATVARMAGDYVRLLQAVGDDPALPFAAESSAQEPPKAGAAV